MERDRSVGTAEHLARRREYTRPVFVALLRLVRELRRAHAPKTLLGRAANYTWKNMLYLGRAMRDARIPLDNNRAENALLIVARGRNNFMFVQGEEAGKELALLYSLVVSCTRIGVNPVDYLADVLDRMTRVPTTACAISSQIDGGHRRSKLSRPILSRSDANDVEKRRSGPRPFHARTVTFLPSV